MSIVQEEIERWIVHSPQQTQLEKKPLSSPPAIRKKGMPLHSMMLLLIGWMEILFLNLAAFGLD
jgi:hypothetical protein